MSANAVPAQEVASPLSQLRASCAALRLHVEDFWCFTEAPPADCITYERTGSLVALLTFAGTAFRKLNAADVPDLELKAAVVSAARAVEKMVVLCVRSFHIAVVETPDEADGTSPATTESKSIPIKPLDLIPLGKSIRFADAEHGEKFTLPVFERWQLDALDLLVRLIDRRHPPQTSNAVPYAYGFPFGDGDGRGDGGIGPFAEQPAIEPANDNEPLQPLAEKVDRAIRSLTAQGVRVALKDIAHQTGESPTSIKNHAIKVLKKRRGLLSKPYRYP